MIIKSRCDARTDVAIFKMTGLSVSAGLLHCPVFHRSDGTVLVIISFNQADDKQSFLFLD